MHRATALFELAVVKLTALGFVASLGNDEMAAVAFLVKAEHSVNPRSPRSCSASTSTNSKLTAFLPQRGFGQLRRVHCSIWVMAWLGTFLTGSDSGQAEYRKIPEKTFTLEG